MCRLGRFCPAFRLRFPTATSLVISDLPAALSGSRPACVCRRTLVPVSPGCCQMPRAGGVLGGRYTAGWVVSRVRVEKCPAKGDTCKGRVQKVRPPHAVRCLCFPVLGDV